MIPSDIATDPQRTVARITRAAARPALYTRGMPRYYFLLVSGPHVVGEPHVDEFASDIAAIRFARTLVTEANGCEAWRGSERIAAFPAGDIGGAEVPLEKE